MHWQHLLIIIMGLFGCGGLESTDRLPSDLAVRVAREGVVRKATDLTFRYTLAPGRRRSHWEDRRATVVVTPATILIHKNSKIGLEVTPRSQREAAVERSGRRIRIRVGSGQSEELWSFEPPDGDVGAWARDLGAVLKVADNAVTKCAPGAAQLPRRAD